MSIALKTSVSRPNKYRRDQMTQYDIDKLVFQRNSAIRLAKTRREEIEELRKRIRFLNNQ